MTKFEARIENDCAQHSSDRYLPTELRLNRPAISVFSIIDSPAIFPFQLVQPEGIYISLVTSFPHNFNRMAAFHLIELYGIGFDRDVKIMHEASNDSQGLASSPTPETISLPMSKAHEEM